MSDCNSIICYPTPMSTYESGGGAVETAGILLNVDFTDATPSDKTGYAAIGLSDTDFWNAFLPAQAGVALALKWSNEANSVVTIRSTGLSGGTIANNGNTDPMVDTVMVNATNHEKTFTIEGLEDGTYDLYLYGYDGSSGNFLIMINGVQWPSGIVFYNVRDNTDAPPWVRDVIGGAVGNYAFINGIPITAGDLLQIKAYYPGGTNYGKISGLQLLKSPPVDNPTSIVEPDVFSATPAYFNSGLNLTAGVYRVSRFSGGMRYDGAGQPNVWQTQSSAVNGYRIVHSGGTTIDGPGTDTFYTSQADLEASENGMFVDFVHTGGPVYMWLKDAVYTDNLGGVPNTQFLIAQIA